MKQQLFNKKPLKVYILTIYSYLYTNYDIYQNNKDIFIMPNFIPIFQKLTERLNQQLRSVLISNYQKKRKMEKIIHQLQSYQEKVHKIKTYNQQKRIFFVSQNLTLAFQNIGILNEINHQLVKFCSKINREAFGNSQLSLLQQKIKHLQNSINSKMVNMNKIIMNLTSEKLIPGMKRQNVQSNKWQDDEISIKQDGNIQSVSNQGLQTKIFISSKDPILQNSDLIKESPIKKEAIRKTYNIMISGEGSAIKQESSIQQLNQVTKMKGEKGQVKPQMKETDKVIQDLSQLQLSQNSGNY